MVTRQAVGFEEDQIGIPGINIFEEDITEERPPLEAVEEMVEEEVPMVAPEPEVPAIEGMEIIIDREEVIEPITLEAPVTPPVEVAVPTFSRQTVTDIIAKRSRGQDLTEEEQDIVAQINARLQLGETRAEIFGEVTEAAVTADIPSLVDRLVNDPRSFENLGLAPGQELRDDRVSEILRSNFGLDQATITNIIQQTKLERQAKREETRIRERGVEAISSAERAIDERLAADVERVEEQGAKRIEAQQRLRSQRGLGRSSATEEIILDEQRQVDSLINQATATANAEKALFRARQEGADSETISKLAENVAGQKAVLETQLQNSILVQNETNAELDLSFQESVQGLLNTLSIAGVEIGEFDDKATAALGYISDSKGNPLKLDAEGNPIAPKNQLGITNKISTFKDANDNTFVYKNGALDSIIQRDGTILTGDQVKTVRVPAEIQADQSAKQQRDTETKLRKEFNNNAQIRRFGDIKSSFQRVEAGVSADSAAGDLALIFAFMKMLDPGSVVRESEFATAANAAGVPEQIRNLFNRVQTGERLGKDQRQDFFGRAEDLFKKETENATQVRDQFVRIAEDAGARTDFITGAFDDLADIRPEIIFTGQETPDEILDRISGKITGKEPVTGDGSITIQTSFESKSTFLDTPIGGLDRPDQTGLTKVSGKPERILGELAGTVTVVEKGGDNPVLGLSGGSLTFRTNNPLAITATSSGSAERLTTKFGAIPNLFSPDSADNLVLNFRTREEGLAAGRSLLEEKSGLTLSKLAESHTGTAATGHKARVQQKGLDLSRTFGDLSEDEKLLVVQAFTEAEGFTEGTKLNS